MIDNNIFIPPRHIYIGEYSYSYKDALINDNYTYRCTFRTQCKIVIKVNKEELVKYKEDNNYLIKYTTTGNTKEHNCRKLENQDDNKNENDISNSEDNLNYKKRIYISIINKKFG